MVNRARGTRRLTSRRAYTVVLPTRNERFSPLAVSTNGEWNRDSCLIPLPT